MLGFEAKKPTGLFQSSTAYNFPLRNFNYNSRYGDGVKYTVASDTTFFGISVKSNWMTATPLVVEVAASLDLGGGFSVFVGGSFAEDFEQFSIEHYNAYVTYETGAWLFAAELNASNAEL